MFNLFGKTKAFGLDISDYSIEVLELVSKSKIKTFGRIVLEEGLVQDGVILNKDALVEKIKEVVKKAKIKSRRVILSLPESKAFAHIFKVPSNIDARDLENTLANEASKTIPLELDDIYWDFAETREPARDGLKSMLFVAVRRETVGSFLEVLERADLEPIVLEIESQALGRAILQPKSYFLALKEIPIIKEKSPVSGMVNIIVDIGARTSNITVFGQDGALKFSSTVLAAGNRFTSALAEKFDIAWHDAEKLKKEYGLDTEKKLRIFREEGKIREESEIMLVLQKELQPIIGEIKKIIEFYGGNANVREIFLAGGSSQMPKLIDYFSSNLDFKIRIGKSLLADQLKGKSILYNTVIGLAQRSLEKNPEKAGINLLPKDLRPKPSLVGRSLSKKKYFVILGTGFSVLALAFLGFAVYFYIFVMPPEKPPSLETSPVGESKIERETLSATAPAEEITETPESPLAETPVQKFITVTVQRTETGWLNVRGGPGKNYSVISRVYPGESYPQLEESAGWYKIRLRDGKEGWISAQYAKKE